MNTDKIKDKLEQFIERYQENIGSFDGLLSIYDFFEFIITEPKIAKLLEDKLEYCEQQMNVILDMPDNETDQYLPNHAVLDLDHFDNFKTPIFEKESKNMVKMLKESEPTNVILQEMPVDLLNLGLVYSLIEQAKEESKTNPQNAEKITETINQLTALNIPFKVKEQDKDKSLSFLLPQYYLSCLAVVSSYIINELTAKEFLKGNKPTSSIIFDKEESLLTIKGTKIKISRTSDLSIDHYILEAIFDQEDISDEVYFKDVAKRMDEFADYDKTKDWRKFYRACEHLNKKIQTDTDNKVINFIIAHTGKAAWCKINPEYLEY